MVEQGVLLTGVFGSGKSSVAIEIAEVLDQGDVPYAAIDVDWLWWFSHDLSRAEARAVMLKNLTAVVHNYMEAGVRRFVLAWALKERGDLDCVIEALPFGLRVVEVSTPIDLIADRLSHDSTRERARNLETARGWDAGGIGQGLAEISVDNTRPLREVALEVIQWLGWGTKDAAS